MENKVRIAIIGLGFGAEFIPIFKDHPNAELVAICQRTKSSLDKIGEHFGISKRYTSYEELLKDPDIDAVHINTPIPDHAWQSIAALNAGKHVACTVPAATTLDELKEIVSAQRKSGKKYMMMETVVYSREYLYIKKMRDNGELGKIQFLRGSHQQEMAGWPGYWEGLPPMHYATHCVSPCLALADGMAEYVACFGSGKISDELTAKYGSPFAVESALVKIKDSDLSFEVTRSLFETAREYIESFDVYGSKRSFEWTQLEGGDHVIFTGEEGKKVQVPDAAELLPPEIRKYTTQGVYDSDENQHLSFTQGSGHGGSHPHMAHEFIMSIIQDRDPFPNAVQSVNWTATGLCAHESAMAGGKIIHLPEF